MAYLYNSFCYSSFDQLKDAIYSTQGVIQNPNQITRITTNYIADPSRIRIYTENELSAVVIIETQQITYDLTQLTTYTNNSVIYKAPSVISVLTYDQANTIKKCSFSGHNVQDMNITLQNPPDNFNPSNLNPADVLNSIGSGFLLVAVPLAVVWAGRHFLRPLFSR